MFLPVKVHTMVVLPEDDIGTNRCALAPFDFSFLRIHFDDTLLLQRPFQVILERLERARELSLHILLCLQLLSGTSAGTSGFVGGITASSGSDMNISSSS